jgi:hypothetical protein
MDDLEKAEARILALEEELTAERAAKRSVERDRDHKFSVGEILKSELIAVKKERDYLLLSAIPDETCGELLDLVNRIMKLGAALSTEK